MHGDIESFFGGGHEVVHHDAHLHDAADEAALVALSATVAAQAFNFGSNLPHLLHNTVHFHDTHHGSDQDNHQNDLDTHDPRLWQDASGLDHDLHLHLLKHSEAHDSNGDGVSDAASKDMGIDPSSEYHQAVSVTWRDAHGHLHNNQGKDSDGDGWSDDIERVMGTDLYDAGSHPTLVEAHHFPAGSDENLPGTIDVTPSSSPWL